MDIFKKSNKREMRNFAKNVTELRIESGITEKEMARLLRTSRRKIKLLSIGIVPKNLGIEVILRIYQIFRIPAEKQFSSLYPKNDIK